MKAADNTALELSSENCKALSTRPTREQQTVGACHGKPAAHARRLEPIQKPRAARHTSLVAASLEHQAGERGEGCFHAVTGF